MLSLRLSFVLLFLALCVLRPLIAQTPPPPFSSSTSSPAPRRSACFRPAALLPAATIAHSATTLDNGDVMVAGGYGKLFYKIPVAANLIRLFDHRRLSWRFAAGRLNFGRLEHAALRLPTGSVLIVGGRGQDNRTMRSIELFHPRDESCTVIGWMAVARRRPLLNLIFPSNSAPARFQVLITGDSRWAELLEPDPNQPDAYTIRPTRSRSSAGHTDHATVSLKDGRVLLIAGRSRALEIFNPADESFHLCSSRLPAALDDQAAVLLYDGRVFIAGGQFIRDNTCTNQTWLFDPSTDTLTLGPVLKPTSLSRIQPGASDMVAVDLYESDPLRRGRYILLCGGENDPGKGKGPDIVLDSAWVFDAERSILWDVGPMLHSHDDFAAALLPPAAPDLPRVLIIAGFGQADTFQANCELFSCRVSQLNN